MEHGESGIGNVPWAASVQSRNSPSDNASHTIAQDASATPATAQHRAGGAGPAPSNAALGGTTRVAGQAQVNAAIPVQTAHTKSLPAQTGLPNNLFPPQSTSGHPRQSIAAHLPPSHGGWSSEASDDESAEWAPIT